MSAWQPIETAPKDGSDVLVSFSTPWRRVLVCRWDAPSPVYLPHWNPGRLEVRNPTHWMPLPEPPK